MVKRKRTNNDLQNITQHIKDRGFIVYLFQKCISLHFQLGSCYSIFSFACMFCRTLFGFFLYFFIWPLFCLFFFYLRILITPLVLSSSSSNTHAFQTKRMDPNKKTERLSNQTSEQSKKMNIMLSIDTEVCLLIIYAALTFKNDDDSYMIKID